MAPKAAKKEASSDDEEEEEGEGDDDEEDEGEEDHDEEEDEDEEPDQNSTKQEATIKWLQAKLRGMLVEERQKKEKREAKEAEKQRKLAEQEAKHEQAEHTREEATIRWMQAHMRSMLAKKRARDQAKAEKEQEKARLRAAKEKEKEKAERERERERAAAAAAKPQATAPGPTEAAIAVGRSPRKKAQYTAAQIAGVRDQVLAARGFTQAEYLWSANQNFDNNGRFWVGNLRQQQYEYEQAHVGSPRAATRMVVTQMPGVGGRPGGLPSAAYPSDRQPAPPTRAYQRCDPEFSGPPPSGSSGAYQTSRAYERCDPEFSGPPPSGSSGAYQKSRAYARPDADPASRGQYRTYQRERMPQAPVPMHRPREVLTVKRRPGARPNSASARLAASARWQEEVAMAERAEVRRRVVQVGRLEEPTESWVSKRRQKCAGSPVEDSRWVRPSPLYRQGWEESFVAPPSPQHADRSRPARSVPPTREGESFERGLWEQHTNASFAKRRGPASRTPSPSPQRAWRDNGPSFGLSWQENFPLPQETGSRADRFVEATVVYQPSAELLSPTQSSLHKERDRSPRSRSPGQTLPPSRDARGWRGTSPFPNRQCSCRGKSTSCDCQWPGGLGSSREASPESSMMSPPSPVRYGLPSRPWQDCTGRLCDCREKMWWRTETETEGFPRCAACDDDGAAAAAGEERGSSDFEDEDEDVGVEGGARRPGAFKDAAASPPPIPFQRVQGRAEDRLRDV